MHMPFTFSLANNMKTTMLRVYLCIVAVVAICGGGRGSSAPQLSTGKLLRQYCIVVHLLHTGSTLAAVFRAIKKMIAHYVVVLWCSFYTSRLVGLPANKYIPAMASLWLKDYRGEVLIKLGGNVLHPSGECTSFFPSILPLPVSN